MPAYELYNTTTQVVRESGKVFTIEELQGLNQLTSLLNAMEIPQPYNPDCHASKRHR